MAIAANDIIQITDEKDAWFPCLLVVDEVRTWGVQAFAFVPESNESGPAGRAYRRLSAGTFERVGSAVVIPAHD